MIFNTQSGITHLSLHTGAAIAFLETKNDFCLTISINGELSIWDLKKSTRILQTSVGTLLARHGAPIPSLKIVRLCLSTNGLPLIALSNGEVFLFSRSLNSWLCIIVGQQKCGGIFDPTLCSLLTAMQFIANSLPNGLISILVGKLQLINDKNKLPLNSQCEEMAASNEEAQLELLLRAAFELESREEYRFLSALYLQKLVKRGEKEKIADFMNDLKTNLSSFIQSETIIDDVRPFLDSTEFFGQNTNLMFNEDVDRQRREKELERSFSWLC